MATKSELILQMKAIKGNTDKVLNDLIKKLDDTEEGVEDLGKESEKTSKKMENAFKSVRKGVNKAAKVTAVATAAVGAMLYKAVSAAREFQTGMTEVSTLLGKDAPALMKKYEKSIKELASTSSSSAAELSKGLYQVISAGTKGTETAAGSMKLLEAAQKAAVAGVSDVFSSVDVITTSLNAYQLSADQATKISDVLFTTVRLGKIDFNQLSAGMGTVASAAAGANVSFEEVNAALAAMTAGGVPSARAFTSLTGILRVAAKGSKELTNAFGESADTILRRDGLLGVLQKLKDVTNGDTIAMQKLGIEQEAITGLSVLASSGIDKFKSSLEEMNNAAGATDVAYQKMSKTFDEQLKKFWNKIDVIMIEVGTDLMPTIQKAMEDFGNYVSDNKEEIIETFKGMATALGFVAKAMGMVAKGWAAIATAIKEGGEVSAMGQVAKKAEWLAHWQNEYNKRIVRTGTLFGGLLVKQKEAIALGIKAGRARAAGAGLLELGGKGMDALGGLLGGPEKPEPGVKEIVSKEEEAARKKVRAAAKAARKKAEAERKAAIAALFAVELANADALQKLQLKFSKEREEWEKRKGLSSEEREWALFKLNQKFEEDLGKLQDKQAKDRREGLKKGAAALENMLVRPWAKLFNEALRAAEAAFEKRWNKIIDVARTNMAMMMHQISGTGGAAALRAAGVKIGAGQFETEAEKKKYAEYEVKPEDEEAGGILEQIGIGALEKIGEVGLDWAMQIGGTLMQGKEATEEMVNGLVDMVSGLADKLGESIEYLASEGVPKIINALIEHAPEIIDALIKGSWKLSIAIIKMIPGIVKALLTEIIPGLVVSLGEAIIDALKSLFSFGSGETGRRIKAAEAGVESGEITEEEAAQQMLDALLFRHEGGIVDNLDGFRNAIVAHQGMFVKPSSASNNVPALLQAGEGVIKESVMSAMGGEPAIDAINNGQGVGGTTVINNVTLAPEHLMAEDTPKIVDRMLSHLQEIGGGGFAGTLQNTGVVEKAAEGFEKVK